MQGLTFFAGDAAAELLISPLRQVVTQKTPTAVYEIANSSDRAVDVKVRWIDLEATKTGYELASPDFRRITSAAPYLIVSPTEKRLSPGERFSVEVSLREGSFPPVGERRSHLLVESQAIRRPLRRASNTMPADIDLGVSTPVMLRIGELKRPTAFFEATRFSRDFDGSLRIRSEIVSEGDMSPYGEVIAEFNEKGGGEPVEIGRVANISAYRGSPPRAISIKFGLESLSAGTLTLKYVGVAEYAGVLFASETFDVAPPE